MSNYRLIPFLYRKTGKRESSGKAGKAGKGESFGKGGKSGKIAVGFHAICWFLEVCPIFGLYCLRQLLYCLRENNVYFRKIWDIGKMSKNVD